MAAQTIAELAGSIAAIAVFGEILSRMRHKPHFASYAVLLCWLTTGHTARTGIRIPVLPLAQSILPALMSEVIEGFPGMDLLRRSSSKRACAVSAGHLSTMEFPFPR